ncbi:helix-turn-helix domain-containing protein [Streptomyces sp. NBC_00237]|uniref:helix-turn-helix domain-containing protein n=1 Tax=Streptomyces sp. NBC_00237 TaxID=2975687 RepID=UPI0022573875|nr:helix-turn-helix domain-containing protein [Streptomyces sp. NBC_00237]MCX5206436.1 helix-turn-helix domain-containing protein [Streptomyces sp. NBC_00237]
MGLSLQELLRVTVAALMQATGHSQRTVADVLGLTQTQVSRRQSGAAAWQLDDIDALAAHYGMRPLDLLDGPARACEALPAAHRRTTSTSRTTTARTAHRAKGSTR